ncbi:hypothetical protein GKE82_06505 [Conexibacter sp. W3-3-2]|uniref:cobalamin B12-binding domain-containing protein n=1 Tax=Conexibacter sp. W3-3-2 TaxID=2675227 RepID=UPI0012B6D11A|nr:cobalamin B12-binding domain-containing protein [Conexibacter sp. W3-3-2]MTD43962.1 hypothetical protein [Conexibacter sp. W3-3-2]
MRVVDEEVEAFAALLGAGDRRGAIQRAVELVQDGGSLGDFVFGMLAPAHVLVCERAARQRRLTPAFQQMATDIADTVLGVAAGNARPEAERSRLVVCVTEREHQNLPARILCELLRAEGHRVAFLGRPSHTAGVTKVLEQLEADALLVSCSLPMNLPCVPQLASAAHAIGVPVIAGGNGFGVDETRGLRLGADAWAPRIADVALAVERFRAERPALQAVEAEIAQQQELTAIRRALTEELADRVEYQCGHMLPRGPRSRSALRSDLHNLLVFLESAVLCDARILADYADWLVGRAAEQHTHPRLVPAMLGALEDRLIFDLPAVGEPLQAARAQTAMAA